MEGTIDSKNAIYWSDRRRPFLGLPISFTKYELKEDRFFITTGFFNIKENEVRLYRVLDVSLTMTFWQRIFGLGTIKVSSSDKTLRDFEIKDVKKPREVKELLSDLVEKQRDAKRVTQREYMGSVDVDDDDDEPGIL